MNEPDVVEQTLSLARGALSPPVLEKARVRSALGPTPWLSGNSPAAHAGVRVRLRTVSLLAAVFVAAVGASFTSGYRLGQESTVRVPPALPAASARVAAERAEPPVVAVPPLGAAPAPSAAEMAARAPGKAERRVPAHRPRAAAAQPEQTMPEQAPSELALLRRVERALRNGEPALALGLLVKLDERFPKSALHEERSASNAMAHCQLRDPGSSERALAFLREHATSVYADSVRFTCDVPVAAGH